MSVSISLFVGLCILVIFLRKKVSCQQDILPIFLSLVIFIMKKKHWIYPLFFSPFFFPLLIFFLSLVRLEVR
jgi:hypothetical protein